MHMTTIRYLESVNTSKNK